MPVGNERSEGITMQV